MSRPLWNDLVENDFDLSCLEELGLVERNDPGEVHWTTVGESILEIVQIGSRLASLRERVGLNGGYVANQLKIWNGANFQATTAPTLSKIETGSRQLQPEELLQLAGFYREALAGDRDTQIRDLLRLEVDPLPAASAGGVQGLAPLIVAIRAACVAGERLLAFQNANSRRELGDDEMDDRHRESIGAARNAIRSTFPGDVVVGTSGHNDESDMVLRTSCRSDWPSVLEEHDGKVLWIMDPIDGQRNYRRGRHLWCVAVAAARWDAATETLRPICAAIYNPPTGELYFARVGGPAMLRFPRKESGREVQEFAPLKLSERQSLRGASLATHLSTTRHDKMVGFLGSPLLRSLCVISDQILALSSGQLALCYVASGRVEAFFNTITYPWDVLAGKTIVQAAGGAIVTGYRRWEEWSIFHDGVIAACNEHIHEAIANLLVATSPEDLRNGT